MEPFVDISVKIPNLLLIAGNGRNVGKTYFACRVIEQLSKTIRITGLKISAHFHPYNEKDVVAKTEQFIIIEEKRISTKDSSLMLQAGAEKVYFIMTPKEYLGKAFKHVQRYLPEQAIICESGGLHEIVTPELFFFIKQTSEKLRKKHHLEYSPLIVNNDGTNFDFDIKNINFSNNRFWINNEQI